MNDNSQVSYEQAKAVKEAHETELMRKANVTGVGVGLQKRGGVYTDRIAIVVMVDRKVSAARLAPEDVVPSQIDGVPVDVQEVGQIIAGG